MAIERTTTSPLTYVGVKLTLPISQLQSGKDLYTDAYQKVSNFLAKHSITPSGPSSFIYEKWDEENDSTTLTLGFEVNPQDIAQIDTEDFEIVNIPQADVLMKELVGSYKGLAAAHQELMDFAMGNNLALDHTKVIEKYLTMDQDESKNVTHIIYLIEQ